MNCRILIILCPFLFFGCEFKTEKAESNDSLKSEADALSRAAIQGKNFLEDGSTYEGELVRGLPHGFGIKEFSNQDLYEGQFQNGKAHGHGTLRYKSDVNLEKYVGLGRMVEEKALELSFLRIPQEWSGIGPWVPCFMGIFKDRMARSSLVNGTEILCRKEKCEMNSGISFRVSLIRWKLPTGSFETC